MQFSPFGHVWPASCKGVGGGPLNHSQTIRATSLVPSPRLPIEMTGRIWLRRFLLRAPVQSQQSSGSVERSTFSQRRTQSGTSLEAGLDRAEARVR